MVIVLTSDAILKGASRLQYFVIFSMVLKYLRQKATGSKFYRLRKAKNCTQKLKALRPNLLNNHSSEL